MDLPTRKLNLITYLAQIKDELFFDKLENYILEREAKLNPELKPFTVQELINRIEMSELDFEDAVQFYTALQSNCSIIITRNGRDFKNSTIPIMTAEEYLNSIT